MIFRLALLTYAGLFTPQLLLQALVITCMVFLGSCAGTRLFHAATPRRFYNFLQLVLLVAAAALFVKGLIYLLS